MSRIVLITGASMGYGKATAKAFKDNGDTVIMTARGSFDMEFVRYEEVPAADAKKIIENAKLDEDDED